MKDTIAALVEKFGSQRRAAEVLGITDRTFRNYVKEPDCVPEPMRRLMKSILEHDRTRPPVSINSSMPSAFGHVTV